MERVTGEVIGVSSPNTDEGSEPHREVGAGFFHQGGYRGGLTCLPRSIAALFICDSSAVGWELLSAPQKVPLDRWGYCKGFPEQETSPFLSLPTKTKPPLSNRSRAASSPLNLGPVSYGSVTPGQNFLPTTPTSASCKQEHFPPALPLARGSRFPTEALAELLNLPPPAPARSLFLTTLSPRLVATAEKGIAGSALGWRWLERSRWHPFRRARGGRACDSAVDKCHRWGEQPAVCCCY